MRPAAHASASAAPPPRAREADAATATATATTTTTTGAKGRFRFRVRGVWVSFPYASPYAAQLDMMDRVVEALQTGANALLESPTGTGKTLCLLCASLAWQRAEKAAPRARATTTTTTVGFSTRSEAMMGGGRTAPVIVYAARTHAQLEQVAKELRATAYGRTTQWVTLASRETQCVHPIVATRKGKEQIAACRALTSAKGCSFKENTPGAVSRAASRVAMVNAQIRKEEDDESAGEAGAATTTPTTIPDVEDVVAQGHKLGFCPYYFTRDSGVLENADLVLMPYNYLIDPQARKGLDVPWSRAVVIIDEAHNIEDVCEDACSFSLSSTMAPTS